MTYKKAKMYFVRYLKRYFCYDVKAKNEYKYLIFLENYIERWTIIKAITIFIDCDLCPFQLANKY